MKAELELIAESFLRAKDQEFAGNPIADFIRHDVGESLRSELGESEATLVVQASPGKGRWTDTPWIAFLDPLITETPQGGYYVVILFAAKMDRVVLSLNQGITHFRAELSASQAKHQLRHLAALFRLQLPEYSSPPFSFTSDPIDLDAPTSTSRAAFYEAGHIIGRTYIFPLPADEVLLANLNILLRLYRLLTYRSETLPQGILENANAGADVFGVVRDGCGVEDRRKFGLHQRIERNATLAKKAKQIHGYRCKACNMDFARRYGPIAGGYIEAHHLTPMSELPIDRPVSLDPGLDFTVLCANCHRVAHLPGAPRDVDGLKLLLSTSQVLRAHKP